MISLINKSSKIFTTKVGVIKPGDVLEVEKAYATYLLKIANGSLEPLDITSVVSEQLQQKYNELLSEYTLLEKHNKELLADNDALNNKIKELESELDKIMNTINM